MTTRQLAEKLDIVPATVVMYENGKHPIPYDVAVKLADIIVLLNWACPKMSVNKNPMVAN